MMDEATGVGDDCDEPPGGNSPAKARAPATAPSAMSANGGARRSRVFMTCRFLSQQARRMWRVSAEGETAGSRYMPTRRPCNNFGPALSSSQKVSEGSRQKSVRYRDKRPFSLLGRALAGSSRQAARCSRLLLVAGISSGEPAEKSKAMG
jgi:hypothetical protein